MSIDVAVAGLTFEGFAPAFAERAGAAFEAAMSGVTSLHAQPRDLGLLVLDCLDFSTPERLGQSLARAILHEVSR